MFNVIFVVSLVVFVVYWRKKSTLAKSLGDGYENDASFLQACKIKKYAGYICLGAVVLSAVTQGSQLIDDIKNLFVLIYAVTFFMFLYYWRKQYTAKKEAGENYLSNEKYIHFKKMKKIVGCVCLAGVVIGTIIPNSPEEIQKQAAIKAKHEAKESFNMTVKEFVEEYNRRAGSKLPPINLNDAKKIKDDKLGDTTVNKYNFYPFNGDCGLLIIETTSSNKMCYIDFFAPTKAGTRNANAIDLEVALTIADIISERVSHRPISSQLTQATGWANYQLDDVGYGYNYDKKLSQIMLNCSNMKYHSSSIKFTKLK